MGRGRSSLAAAVEMAANSSATTKKQETRDRIELNSWKVVSPGLIYYQDKALLKGPMTLEAIFDLSDTWSHRVKWYGRSNTFFEPKASAVASGPLAQTLTIRYEYHNSDADILVRAYRDLPYLDLDIRVRWQEKRSLLKLCFPFAEIREVKVQGPGATIDKKTNQQEEPLHGWLRTETLEILQDGLFAYDRVDDHIRLTHSNTSPDPNQTRPYSPGHKSNTWFTCTPRSTAL